MAKYEVIVYDEDYEPFLTNKVDSIKEAKAYLKAACRGSWKNNVKNRYRIF